MMNRIISLAIVAFMGLSLFVGSTGCVTTPQRTKYKTLYAVAISVDTAMSVWGDHVKAGKATKEQEQRVASAYSSYQTLMRRAINIARYNMETVPEEDVVISVLNLTDIISNLVQLQTD